MLACRQDRPSKYFVLLFSLPVSWNQIFQTNFTHFYQMRGSHYQKIAGRLPLEQKQLVGCEEQPANHFIVRLSRYLQRYPGACIPPPMQLLILWNFYCLRTQARKSFWRHTTRIFRSYEPVKYSFPCAISNQCPSICGFLWHSKWETTFTQACLS